MSAYTPAETADYEARSAFDKGDRAQQRAYVADAVRHLRPNLASFVELGCGTGYFAEAVLEAAPAAAGILVDPSAAMIDLARQRLRRWAARVEFREADASTTAADPGLDGVELAIAALTLHLPGPAARAAILRDLHHRLAADGLLILIDHHLPEDPKDAALFRWLACRDIQRRMTELFGPALATSPDLSIDEILRRDDARPRAKGAIRLSVDRLVGIAREAGFTILPFFQDARFVGLIGRKQTAGTFA